MIPLTFSKLVPVLQRFLSKSLKQVYPASTLALQRKYAVIPTALKCKLVCRSIFQPASPNREKERAFHVAERRQVPPQNVYASLPFVIKIDLRGFKKEEIRVSINENVLSIRATMKRTRGEDTFYEELERHIVLPKELDLANIRSFWEEQGILTIEIPYAEHGDTQRTPMPIERD